MAENIKEDEIVLNPDDLAHTENSGMVSGATENCDLGKFKDAKSLLNAYNSLQSEFTRRSQKVKELQKSVDELKKNSSTFDSLKDEESFVAEKFPETVGFMDELKRLADSYGDEKSGRLERAYCNYLKEQNKSLKDGLTDKDVLFKAVETCGVKDEIIRGYLKDVISSKPTLTLLSGGGGGVVTPPIKPKTIAEAGEIARQYILDKEIIK